MEDGQHAWGAAEEAGVAGNIDDRVRRSLHEQGIAVPLVGAQDLAELLGHGDGHVKVGAREHLELAGLEPALGITGVAFGAAAVFAVMWPAT
jgi:hypothetical protein